MDDGVLFSVQVLLKVGRRKRKTFASQMSFFHDGSSREDLEAKMVTIETELVLKRCLKGFEVFCASWQIAQFEKWVHMGIGKDLPASKGS